MNTGSAIETERLFLLPSRTDRDSEAFLQMLRDDGDFYIFCGVSPSEKHVMGFANYFERTDHELCTYSIFPKQQKDKFIGYVGVHREMEDEYEIEFYIAREYRRNGYCEEASRELINQLFGDGVSANGKNLFIDKLYVTTQTENEPTISLLRTRSQSRPAGVLHEPAARSHPSGWCRSRWRAWSCWWGCRWCAPCRKGRRWSPR